MDFSNINMKDILFSAIPNKFQDFNPLDFEDFICQLFKDKEHEYVERTKGSGDYGADVIIKEKLNSNEFTNEIVIQVKRYGKQNVGVPDLNQVLGAKEYYKAETALCITTSNYTSPAYHLAEKADIVLWDWEKLLEEICSTYFDGLDYYTYFENKLENSSNQTQTNKNKIEFEIIKIDYTAVTTQGSNDCTLIHFNVTNNSDENIYINIYHPDYITSDYKQIKCHARLSSTFTQGTIYSKCSVEFAAFFLLENLSKVQIDDKLIMHFTFDDDNIEQKHITIDSLDGVKIEKETNYSDGIGTYEEKSKIDFCFITTLCFGKHSNEYHEMIYFRDNFLETFSLGKQFIDIYYKYGLSIATWLKPHKKSTTFTKYILSLLLLPVLRINNFIKKK